MANLRIENASMCVRVNMDFDLLNGNLMLTAGYQCFVYKNKQNELEVDIDFSDIEDIRFFNQEIDNSYGAYSIWKENMLKVGLDIDKITNEECFNPQVKFRIKHMLLDIYGENKFHN